MTASAPCASASPTTGPGPVTMLKTPAGSPASTMHSASLMAQIDVDGAGAHTIALPHASAGASTSAGIVYGQFHGVINPATPSIAFARSNAERDAQSRAAAFAAAIARCASARVPSGTVPSASPVAGLVASVRAPDSDPAHSPATWNA